MTLRHRPSSPSSPFSRLPSTRGLRSYLGVAAVSLTMLASPLAAADGASPADATAAQKKDALDHFQTGKQALETKNWEKAVAELRASLDVVNSPNARLELARALRDSGQLGDAWSEYGHVIADATALAAKEERYAKTAEAATTERADVEGKVAFVVVTVAHAPAGATLKVGGHPIPASQWSSPIATSAGAVDVVLADASGKELARQTVAAAVGQKVPATLDAQAAPPPVTTPVPDSPDDRPDFSKTSDAPPPSTPSGHSNLRPYAYAAGGIGVVGMVVFSVFGAMSSSDYNDLKSACSNNACPSSKSGEISDGKTFQTTANVGLVVGIAGIATGATLFVLSLTGHKSPDATGLVLTPGYIGLRGTL
jgi:hypothetical protein